MHALPHSKPSVFLMCCVRVSGSLLQSDGTVVLTHALTSRGRRAECVHLCVCVRVSLGRGHKGTLDIHSYTYAQAHTNARSAQAVSSTREMEGTTQRWIFDLGDRRAFWGQISNSSSISAMQLLFLLLFLAWLSQSLHDPNCVLFLSLIFHAFFFFFLLP